MLQCVFDGMCCSVSLICRSVLPCGAVWLKCAAVRNLRCARRLGCPLDTHPIFFDLFSPTHLKRIVCHGVTVLPSPTEVSQSPFKSSQKMVRVKVSRRLNVWECVTLFYNVLSEGLSISPICCSVLNILRLLLIRSPVFRRCECVSICVCAHVCIDI